jgi:hypothetical protein
MGSDPEKYSLWRVVIAIGAFLLALWLLPGNEDEASLPLHSPSEHASAPAHNP